MSTLARVFGALSAALPPRAALLAALLAVMGMACATQDETGLSGGGQALVGDTLPSGPSATPLLPEPVELAGFSAEQWATAPTFRCDDGETRPEACNREYRALAAARFDGPGTLAACVEERVAALVRMRAAVDTEGTQGRTSVTNTELAQAVVEGLRMAALPPTDGAGLVIGPVLDRGDHRQVDLVLTDPVTGEFPARLLLPPVGGPPPPALLFLPGHFPQGGGQLDDIADHRHGRRLAARGYAVLSIAFRAYDAGVVEFEAVTELLCAGLSQGTLRQREALLALDLLTALAEAGVVAAEVGLLGHSGGGTWATLLGAHADVAVVVFDSGSQQYLSVGEVDELGHVQILDDTMPDLVPLFDCVYELDIPSAVPPGRCEREPPAAPHLWVQYGYTDADLPAVLEILDGALGP